jgi:hypothetical protein
MSVAFTNFTNALAGQLTKVASNTAHSDEAKATTVLEFVDSVIKSGDTGAAITTVLDAAESLVSQHLKGNSDLQQSIQNDLQKRREHFIGDAKQSLPDQLAKQIKPMKLALSSLESAISKSGVPETSSYDIADAKNFFFHGLTQIQKQVASLEGSDIEKQRLNDNLLNELSEKTAKTYGKELSTKLVSDLKSDIIPAELYASQAKSKYKLPVLDLESDKEMRALVKEFNAGSVDISLEKKNEVLSVAEKILNGEDVKLEYHSLSSKQKAYLEHLRQASEQIGSLSNGIDGLLGPLLEKLPDMLMPAIIGAIAGYLMGGMEMPAAMGAVALSFVGSMNGGKPEQIDESQSQEFTLLKFDVPNQKKTPPAPQVTAA